MSDDIFADPEPYIDCSGTDQIVCPYCGAKHDWDEGGEAPLEFECGECEKSFGVETDFSVHYYSRKFDCMNGLSDHVWSDWQTWWSQDRETQYRNCRICGKRQYT